MSVPLLSEFFIHLFEKEKLTFTTVSGYRSALLDIGKALDLPVTHHPVIEGVFAHYRKFVPDRKPKAPD